MYGLGAILYELLDRPAAVPGRRRRWTRWLQVRERGAGPAARPSCPTVDRDLETVCLKCLEKDPARRYAVGRGPGRRPGPVAARRADPGARRPGGGAGGQVAVPPARPGGRRRRRVLAVVLLVGGLSVVTRLYFRSEHYRQDAEQERDAARGRLARQFAEKAGAAADQGDPFLGLPWLVEALKTTDGRPEADLHRLHLGMLLKQAPGLVQYEPTGSCVAIHPDGKRIAIGSKDGVDILPIGGDHPLVPTMKLAGPTTLRVQPGWETAARGRRRRRRRDGTVANDHVVHLLTAAIRSRRRRKSADQPGGHIDPVRRRRLGRAGRVEGACQPARRPRRDVPVRRGHARPDWSSRGSPPRRERMRGDYAQDRDVPLALEPCVRTSKDREDFTGQVQIWELRTGKPLFEPIKPTIGIEDGNRSGASPGRRPVRDEIVRGRGGLGRGL